MDLSTFGLGTTGLSSSIITAQLILQFSSLIAVIVFIVGFIMARIWNARLMKFEVEKGIKHPDGKLGAFQRQVRIAEVAIIFSVIFLILGFFLAFIKAILFVVFFFIGIILFIINILTRRRLKKTMDTIDVSKLSSDDMNRRTIIKKKISFYTTIATLGIMGTLILLVVAAITLFVVDIPELELT
ncbi:hypothetical protein ACFL0L_00960 [Patescibacteria group bacterium]